MEFFRSVGLQTFGTSSLDLYTRRATYLDRNFAVQPSASIEVGVIVR